MPFPIERRTRFVEQLRDIAETDAAKLILSTLIILSVMPRLEAYSLVFFVVFAIELLLRIVIWREKLRSGDFDRTEVVLLAIDFFAILSFLPLESLFRARLLRLARLSRMLMLLGYWKPVVREIWIILTKRERRYQLVFVASSVVILTLSASILLFHLRSFGIDFNENGTLLDDTSPDFWTLTWWAFRQLQDPGNLLRQPSVTLVFAISLILTMAGIFIMAFLIGIGTTVVEELVSVGRERRLGLRDHSLIANLGPHSHTLVEELVTYYAKSFRSPRLVTMGRAPARYDFMYDERLRRVRYRQGSPSVAHDLIKVDADRAKRVILLGKADAAGSDAEVVSQILSVRQANPNCLIFAELFDSANIHAALAAGGNAVPILTNHFLALLQAQVLSSPGSERVYNELLSTHGHEIYTCVFGSGALRDHPGPPVAVPPFETLLRRCQERHDVVLLGLLGRSSAPHVAFQPRLNPDAPQRQDPVATTSVESAEGLAEPVGLFGIAANFEQLKQSALDTECYSAPAPAPPVADDTALPTFSLVSRGRPLKRVLVCGMNDGLIELCDQLTVFGEQTELYVMVPAAEHRRSLIDGFLARSHARANHPTAPHLGLRSSYTAEGPHSLRYHPANTSDAAGESGRIQFLLGDWSDERTLTHPGPDSFELAKVEAIVYTYIANESDPDAKTALGLFKLLRLADDSPGLLHPQLRIQCVIRNGQKADLFERRFADRARQGTTPRVGIVPVERLRNAFIAQAVFVPGISAIYDELLSHRAQRLLRLSVQSCTDPQRDIDFAQLVARIYHSDGLIVIAVEVQTGEEDRVIVTPVRQSSAYRFPAGTLRAVYAIGRAPEPAATGGTG